MIKKIKWLKHPAFIVLLAGGLLSGLIMVSKPKQTPEPYVPPPPPEVMVRMATPGTATVIAESQGTVKPKISTQLVSQVAGQVVSVSENFVAGGFFEAGEVLLTIDSRDYEIALAQSKSQLANARQALAEEKGKALQAKREWRDLGNTDANALFLRKPQLEAAEAAVEAAQAGVTKAQLDLQRTQISLPFAGRVETKSVDIGQYLTHGALIGGVFDSDILEVRLPLTANKLRILGLTSPQQDFSELPVVLTAHYGDLSYKWQGKIVRIEASVNPQTRLFYAIAEVDQASQGEKTEILPVGMFVEAQISSPQLPDIVILPRTALVDREHILVAEQNHIVSITVDVLEVNPDQVKVQGLQSGQMVLITPPGYLTAGMEIKPIPAITEPGE